MSLAVSETQGAFSKADKYQKSRLEISRLEDILKKVLVDIRIGNIQATSDEQIRAFASSVLDNLIAFYNLRNETIFIARATSLWAIPFYDYLDELDKVKSQYQGDNQEQVIKTVKIIKKVMTNYMSGISEE
jgi:hypothetical protein